MDASAYAFVYGIRNTRGTLEAWNRRPWPVLRGWLLASLLAAIGLLLAVWLVASLVGVGGDINVNKPPLAVGTGDDVLRVLFRNSLVLSLHAMACVAGFIAGATLPMQARAHKGIVRLIHERGGPIAIACVVGATAFSLSVQAYVLGISAARVASTVHTTPGLLLLGLLPHALPELVMLFLPLAAWIIASRRGQWDQLLAATVVTVAIAIPVLVLSALWEVFLAPHVLAAVIG